ncbi:pyridoxal phosphate-dependent decarboxylase family protein [Scleromatobacter humisilvae]|uniref:Pyridoxal-dependent decarboxylase n=1 Tax=Scleromatobacter humisilvae TaxID=2897159 RepID=A0A9X1YH48_9BURK|nr:pyridoxal-dependent decarboxylase [Scleromatobacter humisilvae]MCK9686219.1 pyridoxal-dependent decarboxylase [Scleromatobacter humisilvae]
MTSFDFDDTGASLDPTDWASFRAQAHRMLDDILDFTRDIRQRPVWTPAPQHVRDEFRAALPHSPSDLGAVHDAFMRDILPYTAGNSHPGFMGWVQGGGTPVGTLAEMLAAGLNANLGGRDQIPLEVEKQVLHWVRELFAFPATASGLFVTGTSMANLMAVLIARTRALGADVRRDGLGASESRLVAYTSAGAHNCIAQAMDLSGLGKAALRLVPMNERFQIDLAALEAAIAQDRAAGLTPFFVAGTAGTVDVGAVDDLGAVARLADREGLWFHVDGAFGALGMLAPALRPLLAGIEQADSIAFDFHKWGQVPYDAGFLIVRDGQAHLDTFAAPAAYLRRESRGLQAGSPWPCDFGPDLSRGFRALKTWFTFKVHGADRIGRAISQTCDLARHLEQRIKAEPRLELLAPVALNIVCFRYRCADADAANADLLVALQESGLCVPSSTTIDGRFAIRAAIVNHRTRREDVDTLIRATLQIGDRLTHAKAKRAVPAAPVPFVLLPTEQLLTQGGDERLLPVAPGRLNKYGCAPVPDAGLAAFGSSTATSISTLGFAAADRLRGELLAEAGAVDAELLYRRECDRVRATLKTLCGVDDIAGLDIALAASGTDLHLIAAEWASGGSAKAPLVIMMDACETGSGVAAALGGRHFGEASPQGAVLVAGAPVDQRNAPEVVQVAIRDDDGAPRPLADVHAQIESQVVRAVAADRRVLLIALDVSKTGLLVPGPAWVAGLRRRWPRYLDVVVDACQFRLSPASLRRYLDTGCLVAMTGSKFLAGPTFCGALFIPPAMTARWRDRPLPPALSAYSARAEWPQGWAAATHLDDATNFGLLLRWQAALAELQAFADVPATKARDFVETFAAAVRARVEAEPALRPLQVHALQRGAGDDASWDATPTIFPFVLHRLAPDGTRVPLTRAETLDIYRLLPDDAAGPRCQLGQPVACGSRDGVPVSALRLCLSARLIVEATADGDESAARVIARALAALDKLVHLVATRHPSLSKLQHA